MASLPEPAIARRSREFRHGLVVELVLRRGDRWASFDRLRAKWQIRPTPGVPPAAVPDRLHSPKAVAGWSPPDRAWTPPGWSPPPRPVRPAALPPIRPDPRASALLSRLRLATVVEREPNRWEQWSGVAWAVDIEGLFVETVPPDLRLGVRPFDLETSLIRGMYRAHLADVLLFHPWGAFISGCALYDPPRDDLAGYANHVVFPVDLLRADPIALLRDPDEAVAIERWHRETLVFHLTRELLSRGLDIQPLVDTIEAAIEPQILARLAQNPPRPYIDPTASDDLSAADVNKALRVIRASRPKPPRQRRDPLVAVQCAIWRDTYGWSLAEIGRHFGWPLQPDPHFATGPTRCSTAQRHVSDGREILGTGRPDLVTAATEKPSDAPPP